MHRRSVEVGVAGGVDEELQPLAFEFEVIGFADIKSHPVFEAGTAASLHEDPEYGFGIGLGLMKCAHLLGGGFGEDDHDS